MPRAMRDCRACALITVGDAVLVGHWRIAARWRPGFASADAVALVVLLAIGMRAMCLLEEILRNSAS